MTLVADQQDVVIVAGEALRLVVYLGDERAGRVNGRQVPAPRLFADLGGDAVRGEHDHAALGDLFGLLDEDGAALLQLADHVRVMHDLLAHVYGSTELAKGDLHGLDGPVDPCAVAPRLR
jgi:hypothetical protein